MKQRAITTLITTVTLLVAPAAGAVAGSGAAKLQLVKRAPLQITGSHFKPRELVRLTASTTSGRASAAARTNRHGRLVATFSDFGSPQCLRLVVKAVGARGDRARLVVDPPPSTTDLPCTA